MRSNLSTKDTGRAKSNGKGKGNGKDKGKGNGKGNGKGKGKGKQQTNTKKKTLCSCSLDDSCECRDNSDFYQELDRFLADITTTNKSNSQSNKEITLRKYVPSIMNGSHGDLRPIVMKNSMPTIERLFAPINNSRGVYGSEAGLYPTSYGGPIGPKCNWRKCSNKGGCGTECTCHPAGQYGWRCIPDCCIGTNGSPPCRYKYNAHVQCTLPCSTWPGLCQQNFFNPYHQYQGPLQYPKSYGPALTAAY